MPLQYTKHDKIWLKNHPEFNEAWVAAKIAAMRFERVCRVVPDPGTHGKPAEFFPQGKYSNPRSLPLHPYGNGAFCRFRIPKNVKGKQGVYVLRVDGKLKYIGKCRDLRARFNAGYGQISPRNCFKNGQRTNCRINKEILKAARKRARIDPLFYETRKSDEVERRLIADMKPPWNIASGTRS